MQVSGRRYFSPSHGRFLGRDPKREKGGLNLYGFCGNNGVNQWDYLGMNPMSDRLASELEYYREQLARLMDEERDHGYSPGTGPNQAEQRATAQMIEDLEWQLGQVARGTEGARDEDAAFIPPLIGIGIVLAGEMPVGQPRRFLGQTLISDLSRIYGSNKLQVAYANTEMLSGVSTRSGSGQELYDHFKARGLDTRDRATPTQILIDLGDTKVDVLTIGAHGGAHYMNMASGVPGRLQRTAGAFNMLENEAFWTGLAKNIKPGGTIALIACQVADSQKGIDRLQAIANWTGAHIVAPTGLYAIGPGGEYAVVPAENTPEGVPMGFVVIAPK